MPRSGRGPARVETLTARRDAQLAHCYDRIVRIALLSDIHANLEALEACLAHAQSHRIDAELKTLLNAAFDAP